MFYDEKLGYFEYAKEMTVSASGLLIYVISALTLAFHIKDLSWISDLYDLSACRSKQMMLV